MDWLMASADEFEADNRELIQIDTSNFTNSDKTNSRAYEI
jgi:hypothetical protein